jgi:hypothetical protein
MTDLETLLVRAARAAAEHRRTVGDRHVATRTPAGEIRAAFAAPLPDEPTDPDEVLSELLRAAAGGITGSVGPRYFGFVIGGALPAATAAEILTTGWDQAAYNPITADFKAHIHFRFKDGTAIEPAFTYEWRLWSIPELRELRVELSLSERQLPDRLALRTCARKRKVPPVALQKCPYGPLFYARLARIRTSTIARQVEVRIGHH